MNLAEHLRSYRNRLADLSPLVNDRYQLLDRQPMSRCVNHAVTVGAQQTKVFRVRFLARFQRVKRFGVVALNEPIAVLSVPFAKIETASLTREPT